MGAIDHVRHLAETIGPRGSTTAAEAQAADYAEAVLSGAGLQPITESFRSPRSAWLPYALFSALMLMAVALHLVGQEFASLLLVLFSVSSALLELSFRANPLRWLLPTGQSQNVSSRIRPKASSRRQVLLLGHLDSHRTPLVFSSPGWLKVFRVLVPLGLAASFGLLLLIAARFFDPEPLWRNLSLAPAVVFLLNLAITVQADLTPYSHGANDNASGAGVVLSLAERLAADPLPNTETWVVLTGCEEVGCHGAEAFARKHAADLEGAVWLTIDAVGGGRTRLTLISKETFLLPVPSDPQLLQLGEEVAADHPELGAQLRGFAGAYTESVMGAKYGHPVLTFIAVGAEGLPPEWHRTTDVVQRIDESALARCEAFVWEMLQRLDRAGA